MLFNHNLSARNGVLSRAQVLRDPVLYAPTLGNPSVVILAAFGQNPVDDRFVVRQLVDSLPIE